MAVHVPWVARASVTPSATARRQYAFISTSTPRRTRRPSSRRNDAATGTCLASDAMRSGPPVARRHRAALTRSGRRR